MANEGCDCRAQERQPEKRTIDCDRVCWLMDVIERAMRSANPEPSISRQRKAAKLAALLEIMDIFSVEFADDMAAGNAISAFPEFNALRRLDQYTFKAQQNARRKAQELAGGHGPNQ